MNNQDMITHSVQVFEIRLPLGDARRALFASVQRWTPSSSCGKPEISPSFSCEKQPKI